MTEPYTPREILRAPEPSRYRGLVFAISLLLHGSLALALRVHAADRTRPQSPQKVDIEFAKPPPPPPPPPPEPEVPPEPQVQEQPRVQPKTPPRATPKRVAKIAAKDPPPDLGSALPSSDEGELPPAPPGDGIPGPEPVAAPAPPPPPPPPPPVIQAKEGANYLKNPRPPYPRIALREGWEGKVVLRVRVLPSGKVESAQVQKSAGRDVLDEAALDIVKTWTFVPATQGGEPIAGWVSVPFEFKIN